MCAHPESSASVECVVQPAVKCVAVSAVLRVNRVCWGSVLLLAQHPVGSVYVLPVSSVCLAVCAVLLVRQTVEGAAV